MWCELCEALAVSWYSLCFLVDHACCTVSAVLQRALRAPDVSCVSLQRMLVSTATKVFVGLQCVKAPLWWYVIVC